MAISDTVIRIKRGGNAPAVPITFANVDLTGSVIEMVLTPANGGQAVTITTEEAGLELALPNGVIWSYTEALAAILPEGRRTYVDFWRVIGDQREAIGAGTVTVLKSGELGGAGGVQIEVPGIQGPPPWVHKGPWSPGTYEPRSVTTHNGSTWLTMVATDEEPGLGSDWEVLAAKGDITQVDLSAALAELTSAERVLAYVYGVDGEGDDGRLSVATDLGGVMRYLGPSLPNNPIAQSVLRDNVSEPFASRPAVSNVEWQHNSAQAYLIHLTQGPNMGASAALIGLGVDEGGRGLFVNNKKTGQGIVITQNSTITSTTAFGMLVNGGKGAAPAVFMQQNNDAGSGNAQPLLVLHAFQSFHATAQRMMEWRKPDGTAVGALAGYIRSSDGALVQQAPLITSGADITAQSSGGIGGGVYAEKIQLAGAGANVDLSDSGGTTNQRRFRASVSANILVISGRNDAGTGTGDLLYLLNTSQNIGFAGQNSFGGGTKCLAIPNAGAVPTTNPAGGVVEYAEGGSMKVRTPGGNVVTVAPNTKPSITGSRGANAALASLLTVLAAAGLVSDDTSA